MTASPRERAIVFDCEGESLVGILHSPRAGAPEDAATTGVVIVVGGPQYRAGSHRLFVRMARALSDAGYPTLRFDVRGMGDSTGAQRAFEQISPDIGAAVDALLARQPQLRRVVLWGLCDAASAALLYLHEWPQPQVSGLCLLNPWVRSTRSLARTHVKHYYVQRLLQPTFWTKLLTARVKTDALRGLWAALRATRQADQSANPASASFQTKMASALAAFGGEVLLILSGQDYTAKEFLEFTDASTAWKRLIGQSRVQRVDLPDAEHTFASPSSAAEVQSAVLAWLAGQGSTPPAQRLAG